MKFLSSIIILIFLCGIVLSQNRLEDSLDPKTKTVSMSCEENNSQLSALNQHTAQDELIIIVSHLGKNEKKIYAQRRLHNAEIFLTKGAENLNHSPEYIVTAQGKTSENTGYLDFYIKGKSALQISFKKNNDLRLPPCVLQPEEKPCETDFEKLVYPCKSENKK